MSLNPLSIAHLGIGRRPIVAALLGIWDELVSVLAEEDDEDNDSIGGFFGPEPRLMLDPRPRRRRREEEGMVLCGLC